MAYSEKAVSKLYENMICFADKLTCPDVYENISGIIEKARKAYGNRSEIKQFLDEFELKVNECKEKGLTGGTEGDESEIAKVVGTPTTLPVRRSFGKAGASAARAGPPASKKKQVKPPSRRAKKAVDSDDDDVESERPASRPTRTTRDRKPRTMNLYEESDEDE
jgi:hypothetical protein